jgi:hypothetical protein
MLLFPLPLLLLFLLFLLLLLCLAQMHGDVVLEELEDRRQRLDTKQRHTRTPGTRVTASATITTATTKRLCELQVALEEHSEESNVCSNVHHYVAWPNSQLTDTPTTITAAAAAAAAAAATAAAAACPQPRTQIAIILENLPSVSISVRNENEAEAECHKQACSVRGRCTSPQALSMYGALIH